MSNKETLQQNNSRLNMKNVELTSILDTINNLPENVEIKLQEKSITPTTTQQEVVADEEYTGLSKVTVEKITGENLNVIPSSQEQNFNGVYTNVEVAGESNLIAENIKEGTSIFGVEGNAKTTNAKITDCYYLFQENRRIDSVNELLSLCENVTDMRYMFYRCSNLTELDLSNFDTSKVNDMRYVFSGCSNLTGLDVSGFDTSNVNVIRYMFQGCSNLTELDLSNFDTSKVINCADTLNSCYGLKNFKSFKNLGKGFTQETNNYSDYKLNLSNSTKLSYESLMDVINNLYDLNLTYDVANGGTLYTQSLVLGSTNLAKLTTSEEIAIATAKGWTVS